MKPGPLKSLFLEAYAVEKGNLENQEVYKLEVLKKGQRTTRSMAVFDLKWNPITGLLDKAKCRIVAQGFTTQVPGVDFGETYASTPKLSTMRAFLWDVVRLLMITEEFDVKAAYLHAKLEELIYMRPPTGMETYDEHGNLMVMRLLKSLYGLRQSGHNWMNDFFDFLRDFGWTQSKADTSLWHYLVEEKVTMSLFVHTDDGKFGYVKSAKDHRDKFVDALNKRFNIGSTQLNIDRIFNIKVDRRSDGSIKLSQQKYILDLIIPAFITFDSRQE
mmetsp:Transcript_4766/g.10675  ORF Transcript_4766/g.10675 Transcript_4766/m.10675 type:complete len:273 (+) Transcript_4766:34-852(+)|eukprot:CAMPEP_0206128652 /NCGR_PEP_ID=MMETSP1472-20131121/32945_1 /ASSEMBLY_ACC=CAM_ASM_001108 /TAXON_ID=41880 /ORGANISM="Pycnococcus provasolii, Strain RCC251" /LENGTH=272 /DNA_ID=CAMNT_0053519863 /DNA_START=31 /DNA_END=849 /DNA_ORIENTATION=-